MSGGHDLYLDMCAALALGSIEPQERRALDEHLAGGCAECSAFLRDACGPLEALALSLPSAQPSRGLKARVMVAVSRPRTRPAAPSEASQAPGSRARWMPALPGWAWTTAALLLVALGVGWWRASVLAERVRDLEGQAVVASDPEAEIERFRRSAPQAREVAFAAQPGADASRKARVLYDAARRRALVVLENFAAPAGSDFELWTVRDKQPYSEGLVRVGADGRGTHLIENVGDPSQLAAFAVSTEAAGGAKDRQSPATVSYVAPAS